MPIDTVHQCPRCELRFAHRGELEDHLRVDHQPDVSDDVPAPPPVPAGACEIVVPVEPSQPATSAVPVAAVLARQAGLGIEIVTAPPHGLPRPDLSARVDEARAGGATRVEAAVLGATTDPAAAIADHLRRSGATLVCMATRGRGPVSEAVLGSVSAAVVRRSPVPVLLVGPRVDRFGPRVERIIAGVDGSELSAGMVPAAARLAASIDAELVLVHVVTDGGSEAGDDVHFEFLHGLASDYPRQPVQEDVVHHDDQAAAIASYGGEFGDTVIAVSTHGRGALGRLALGSVARTVAQQAACPVLVVPPTRRAINAHRRRVLGPQLRRGSPMMLNDMAAMRIPRPSGTDVRVDLDSKDRPIDGRVWQAAVLRLRFP